MTIPVSILILTRNEESDLAACLESVAWSNDVHVFDSFSTDATAAIAQAGGASVTQREFDGYSTQRNVALRGLSFKHPWVLILDADERIPAALRDEIDAVMASPPANVVAFRIRRRDFLLGRWLKHAQISPFYIRLVRPQRVHYEREINEVLVPEGPVAELAEPFDHFPFSKGMVHWIDKHNRYSTMEAKRWHEERREGVSFEWKKALFAKDFSERRYHQKGLFYRLPGRPLIKFLYMYLGRRGFLDGGPGLSYCLLQSIYEFFIVLKAQEQKLLSLQTSSRPQ